MHEKEAAIRRVIKELQAKPEGENGWHHVQVQLECERQGLDVNSFEIEAVVMRVKEEERQRLAGKSVSQKYHEALGLPQNFFAASAAAEDIKIIKGFIKQLEAVVMGLEDLPPDFETDNPHPDFEVWNS